MNLIGISILFVASLGVLCFILCIINGIIKLIYYIKSQFTYFDQDIENSIQHNEMLLVLRHINNIEYKPFGAKTN